jgi:polysaccharide biosynthesis protein PslG
MIRLVVLVATLSLLAPAPASAARRLVPAGWLGVVADGPLTAPDFAADGEWDRLASSGAESVRTAFYWRDIQPGGPGDADFSRTDPVVLAAAKRGLTTLPILQGTPDWAALHPGDLASPPRDPADFARVLTTLVTRYGPRGSLWAEHPEIRRRPVRDWQIWNEPNLTRYWNVAPWAPSYVALLKAAHAALKAADRGSRTILAGLPNESWLALRELYRQGAHGAFDAVALHPYTGRPRNVIKLIEFARREMRKHGDRRKPVWLTELSWPASKGRTEGAPGFVTTEKGQASRLKLALRLLAGARKRLRIERVVWYTWISREGSQNSFDWSGLRRVRGDQLVTAPSFSVYRAAAKRLAR